MVRCDLEGVTGVVSQDQVQPTRPDYASGRTLFMHDLLALLEGLLQGGAEEVVLFDMHATGRNIDVGRLPEGAVAICGNPPVTAGWPCGLDRSFVGLVLLGLHAMAFTPNAPMGHSYDSDIRRIRLNGRSMGEIGVEAAIAGELAAPTLLVVADSEGAREARDLLPGVCTVAVKESLSETSAVCPPPAVTGRAIREAAAACLQAAVAPLSVEARVRLEVELCEGGFACAFGELFPELMTGERTVHLGAATVLEAWAGYVARKRAAYQQVRART